MSTKNTPAVVLATEDQVDHIAILCDKAVRSVVRALPRDTAQRAITNGGLLQRHVDRTLANFFAEEFEEFLIEIDPNVSFEVRVQRGNYGFVNENIRPANFNLTKSGKRRIVLYDPKGDVSSKEMTRRMAENGDRPAVLDDALELGYKFPDRQRKNPIVFLGEETVWQGPGGDRRVPVLSEWYDLRELSLSWFDRDWFAFCRFAAVREF